VPTTSGPVTAAPVRERRAAERRAPERFPAEERPARRPDRQPDRQRDRQRDRRSAEEIAPAERPPEERAPVERRTEQRRGADRKPADRKPADRKRKAAPPAEDFSTGPIPVVRPEDLEEDASPRESALAWARFLGELVIALAAGVGIYFLFNVLWENLPYVAVLLAPFAVTALVGGVTFWRQRMGHEPVGSRLLVVLVFAGTLLTIVPAAQLLNPT
jgi:hypothetical protein